MWLIGYRFHCVLIVTVSVLTVLAMLLGDAYADVLIDTWGARPGILDKKVLQAMQWRNLVSSMSGIYLFPIFSVFIAYRLPRTRLIFIALSLLFMWAELYAIGGGGDRKGCEECGLSLFFYGLAFPVLYPLIMGIALGMQFCRTSRQLTETNRKLDKVLAGAAGLFSLLMFVSLLRLMGW